MSALALAEISGMVEAFGKWAEMAGGLARRFDPFFSLALFLAASCLMIWRLGVMENKGLEGTVLGTLIMPYASGFSNLSFAYVMGRTGSNGVMVLENCLVNNVTNLTLLIGLPALIWSLNLKSAAGPGSASAQWSKQNRLNYLSLLFSLTAMFFFTGALWVLARDGVLNRDDGLVLVGLFLFWQVIHIFDVMKNNVRRRRSLPWSIAVDIVLVVAGGYGVFKGIDRLVAWIPKTGQGLLVFDNLGWLSGLLMVLPNGLLAAYYAYRRRADIVYSSQIGDGHICIPMAIGLFAIFTPIQIPSYLPLAMKIILAAGAVHFLFIAFWGRLPRLAAVAMAGAYTFFIYKGILPG